jgi:hypothetical protein
MGISVPNGAEITGKWRKMNNEKLYNLFFSYVELLG